MNAATEETPETPNRRVYLECMEELRWRLNVVKWIATDQHLIKPNTQDGMELMLLQLRMSLELIAFSSLTANKHKYAAVHAGFETHWRAAKMLKSLEKINPNFYPIPAFVKNVGKTTDNRERWEYQVLKDGYLTKDDFIFLYDVCSVALHSRNPFSPQTSVELKYDLPVWVERIRQLIRIHFMHFVDERRWLVYVPDHGTIDVLYVKADPNMK